MSSTLQAKCDTVLSQRTRALWGMVESSTDGILDMNKAWQRSEEHTTLKDTEKRLDELIETALEQVNHTCEDEISEKYPFLVQSCAFAPPCFFFFISMGFMA